MKSARCPRVSVVMAVFNSEQWLAAAIDSVLQQTLSDFELILIDDGSRDASRSIIDAYDDSRIVVLENTENSGLAVSLNRGLAVARGEYVARMDADDLCRPDRLRRQVAFMEQHPQYGAVGCWVATVGDGKHVWQPHREPKIIAIQLLFDTPLLHPTVMFRRELFARHQLSYDPEFAFAQDYDLWERAAQVTQLANIDEVLLDYRLHVQQVGSHSRSAQLECADAVRNRQLRAWNVAPTADELALHNRISRYEFEVSQAFLADAARWFNQLLRHNQVRPRYEEQALRSFLADKWWMLCNSAEELGFTALHTFASEPLSRFANVGVRDILSFTVRCCGRKLGVMLGR